MKSRGTLSDGIDEDHVHVLIQGEVFLEFLEAFHAGHGNPHDLAVGLDLFLGRDAVIVDGEDADLLRPGGTHAVHGRELRDGRRFANAGRSHEDENLRLLRLRLPVDGNRIADPVHDRVLDVIEIVELLQGKVLLEAFDDLPAIGEGKIVFPEQVFDPFEGWMHFRARGLGCRSIQFFLEGLDFLEDELERLVLLRRLGNRGEDFLLLLFQIEGPLLSPVVREITGDLNPLAGEETQEASGPDRAVSKDFRLLAVLGPNSFQGFPMGGRLFREILHYSFPSKRISPKDSIFISGMISGTDSTTRSGNSRTVLDRTRGRAASEQRMIGR